MIIDVDHVPPAPAAPRETLEIAQEELDPRVAALRSVRRTCDVVAIQASRMKCRAESGRPPSSKRQT